MYFAIVLASSRSLGDPRVAVSFPPYIPLLLRSLYHILSCLTSKSGLQLNSGPVEVDENHALLEPIFNVNGFLTLVLV